MKTTSTYNYLTPSKLTLALGSCIAAGVGVMISGAPGVGKSALVYELAKTLGLPLVDRKLGMMADSSDLLGPLMPDGKGGAVYHTPHWLTETLQHERGILFLDEYNSAPSDVQASGYDLLQHGRAGDFQLNPGWVVILAGNRVEDRAFVNQMPSAAANRIAHLGLTLSASDWLRWAEGAGIDEAIVEWVQLKGEAAFDFDGKRQINSTPRTLEMLSKLLSVNPHASVLNQLVGSVLPEGHAREFTSYLKLRADIPKLSEIVADPEGTATPDNLSSSYALAGMCASAASKTGAKYLDPITTYLGRISKEIVRVFWTMATRKSDALKETTQYVTFEVENQSDVKL